MKQAIIPTSEAKAVYFSEPAAGMIQITAVEMGMIRIERELNRLQRRLKLAKLIERVKNENK